jgi:hypothetical protein
MTNGWRRARPGFIVGPSVFVFGSSGLFKQVKGWRLFMIAGVWASFVRLGGRGADEREKGTPAPTPQRRGTRGKRQADRSDVRQEYVRFTKPDPASTLSHADGRQPFMPPRVSHDPCLLMLPFRFAHARLMRPLSVGRMTTPFRSAMRITMT